MAFGKKNDEKSEKTAVEKTVKSKKSAKIDTKKSAKNLFASALELRDLDISKLQEKLAEARADLLNKQKMLKANELPATHVIRETRRYIARLKMVLNEKVSENQANGGKEKDE